MREGFLLARAFIATGLVAVALPISAGKVHANTQDQIAQEGDATCCITPKPREIVPRAAAVTLGALPPSVGADPANQSPIRERPWMPVPGDLPVPDSARRSLLSPPETRRVEQSSSLASPAPSASFLALDDDNTAIPPDTHGAVGPNHLMTTLNTQFRIQDRSGNPIVTRSLNTFWASVRAGIDTFDPQVLYDAGAGRWITIAAADSEAANSAVLVGVSQSSDPTGLWFLYQVDADAADLLWADRPNAGFNSSILIVQVNMYERCGESNCTDGIDNDGDGSVDETPFNRSQILVLEKNALYAGLSAMLRRIDVVGLGGGQVPALTFDPGAPIYLLQDWDGNANGSGYLRLYMITGGRGAETVFPIAFPTGPAIWDTLPPGRADFAPQFGSIHKIQANDSRILNVVYRNGSIWGAQTVFLPAGGFPTRSAVQWWEIATNGTVRQRGLIDDPSGTNFVAFPSLAVNRNGDALIGYSRFAASRYASAGYSFRAFSDPAGSLRSDVVLKNGEAPYYKQDREEQRNRWGDYSATSVDPTNDTDFWTIQEFAAIPRGGYDRWGTWWGRISPSGNPPPGICTPAATTLCLNNQRFSVQVDFATQQGQGGTGTAVPNTTDTGMFWFFTPNNIEVIVKVVNGCSFNQRYWVFAAGLTNVAATIRVTDTRSGIVRTYLNRQGTAFQPVQDTAAFATCP